VLLGVELVEEVLVAEPLPELPVVEPLVAEPEPAVVDVPVVGGVRELLAPGPGAPEHALNKRRTSTMRIKDRCWKQRLRLTPFLDAGEVRQ